MDNIDMGSVNMKKETRYLRIPKEIIDKNIEQKPFEDIMAASVGFRCGYNKSVGYDVERDPGEEYLVKYCVEGYGWFEVEGMEYKVGPGDVIICKEHVLHKYRADTNNPWSVYWAYFIGRAAAKYFEWIFSTNRKHVVHIGYDSLLEQHFEDMILVMEKGYALHYVLHASNLLKLVFSHLIKRFEPSGFKNRKESALERTIQFMLDNLQHTITLEQMAKKTGMSKDHFTKMFSKRYGYTPMDYFIRMKMQKACELLVTTEFQITQIAEELGYSDYYYFSRLFKTKTRFSPREFRKKYL
jgi:AraC family transcriptional regulator, arabinose operon regulatory protein